MTRTCTSIHMSMLVSDEDIPGKLSYHWDGHRGVTLYASLSMNLIKGDTAEVAATQDTIRKSESKTERQTASGRMIAPHQEAQQ